MTTMIKGFVLLLLLSTLVGCADRGPDFSSFSSDNSDGPNGLYVSNDNLSFFAQSGGTSADAESTNADSSPAAPSTEDSTTTDPSLAVPEPVTPPLADSSPSGSMSADPDDMLDAPATASPPEVPVDRVGTWRVGPSIHSIGESGGLQQSTSLTSSDGAADYFVLLVSTSGFQPENGGYAGSALTLRITAGDPGLYTLVEDSRFVSALQSSSGTSIAALTVIAGTQQSDPVGASAWSSVTGSVLVAIDAEGFRHVTSVEPLILQRTSNLGDGVPGAPDQIELELFDVFAIRNE